MINQMKMKEVNVPETRGAKAKYDFDLKVGEQRKYPGISTNNLLTSAKGWCKYRKLEWKFRCYTMDGFTYIIRVQ